MSLSEIQRRLSRNENDQRSSISAIGLCHKCRQFAFDILVQEFPPDRWADKGGLNNRYYFTHSLLSDLHQYARSDCKLCKLMLDFAKDCAAERNTALQQGTVTIRASIQELDTFWVEIPVAGTDTSLLMASCLEFYPTKFAGIANSDLSWELPKPSQTAYVSNDPTSQEAFELARYWLAECCRGHIDCRQPQQEFSPCRLVDVGLLNSSIPVCLREDIVGRPQYVTLSHCWGQDQTGITTRSNLIHRKQQIHLADLPVTFRDAIFITRNLGIRYLWIDSLCIVQDSSEDWKRNCAEMSAIYSNSLLTIGALWAQNSHSGILCNRATRYPGDTFQNVIISSSSSCGKDKNNDYCAVGARVKPWNFEYALNSSKLDKRGWVFQERILSPATLYYWTSEMYWECRTCKASESRPKLISHGDGHTKGILHQMQRDGLIQHRCGHYTAWYLLIENYTRKELTYLSDKYPAILGLVIKFRERFSATDISGIWAEDFHRGIIWQRWVCDKGRPSKTIACPDAPSWSWLAVDLPVVFAWLPRGGGMTSFYPKVRKPAVSDAIIVNVRLAVATGIANSIKAYCKIYADVIPVSCKAIQPNENRGLRGWSVIKPRKMQGISCPDLYFVPDWDFDTIGRAYCMRIASWQHAHDTQVWQGLKGAPQPVFTYYLLIQREKDSRPFRSALDIGAFSRVGVGAATTADVESFFTHSSRRLLKLL